MGGFFHAIFIIGAVALPLVAMPLLWRRMKRVRNQAYQQKEAEPFEPTWQETLETRDGLKVVRTHDPNDELISLGDRARHSHWPISDP